MEYTEFSGEVERIGFLSINDNSNGVVLTLVGYSTLFLITRPDLLPFVGLTKPGDSVSFSAKNRDRYTAYIQSQSFNNISYPRAVLGCS